MLAVAYLLSVSGMIILPILLAFYLTRKFNLSWKLVLAGALTFIASQVLHIPVVYGSMALFNDGTLPPIPEAGRAIFNAILLGLLAGIFEETARPILMRNGDLSAFGIPADQFELAQQQVAEFWSAPVYMAFLGLFERAFAICLHLSLSVMVLYSVVYGKPVWFWIALLWHALVDALVVYLLPTSARLEWKESWLSVRSSAW